MFPLFYAPYSMCSRGIPRYRSRAVRYFFCLKACGMNRGRSSFSRGLFIRYAFYEPYGCSWSACSFFSSQAFSSYAFYVRASSRLLVLMHMPLNLL